MNRLFLKTLSPGDKLQNGKYIIIEVFGQGYFSVTYFATQSILNKRVIVQEFFLREHCLRNGERKVVNEKLEFAIYERFRDQWFEEAKTIARFSSNEHIVTILDTFQENDTLYYVTEYINEEDLQTFTLAQREKRLTEDQSLDFIFQIADGLSCLHMNAVFHLDLCPAKILIDKSKKAIIVNFGIGSQNIPVEVLPEMMHLLKSGYSPPELYNPEEKYGIFSDIYSLGAIFYFLLTGKDPVPAPERITKPLPEPKSLNPLVSNKTNRAIMKALDLIPEKRYQRVSDFVDDLHRSGKPWKPKKWVWGAVLLLLLILITVLGVRLFFPSGSSDQHKKDKILQHNTELSRLSVTRDGEVTVTDQVTDETINVGKFYALLIGIEKYKDTRYRPLDEPINDVNALEKVLVDCYTFDKKNVFVLRNPVKKEIFEILNSCRDNLTPDDNLFVFYAGHGRYIKNPNIDIGYLIPADADFKNECDWIPYQDIRNKFAVIKAKKILFIADACYAGSVFRGDDSTSREGNNEMVLEQLSKKSRIAITSADLKPVPDKSDFLKYLISNLKNNKVQLFPSEDLYINTRNSLIRGTSRKDPVIWGRLLDCGHEAGDFIFIRRADSMKKPGKY